MPFKKGKSKTGGRKLGTQNRITKEAKEILEKILFCRIDHLASALDKLEDDPVKYIDAISKLFPYVLAKKTDVTSDDMPLQPITGIRIIKDDS